MNKRMTQFFNFLVCFAFIVSILAVGRVLGQARGTWVELGGSASGGGISNNSGNSDMPVVVLDSRGNPIVTWTDYSAGVSHIYIKRWDGEAWVEIGKGSASGNGLPGNKLNSQRSTIILDSENNPVVVWTDANAPGKTWEIYAKRWNGGSWVEIGRGSASGRGLSNNRGDAGSPSVVLDSSGNPMVAYSFYGRGNEEEIYVKRFDGSGWVEVGKGSASGGGISNNYGASAEPSIVLGPDGNPIVAWNDASTDYYTRGIFLRRFNGRKWVEMGAGSASGMGLSDVKGNAMHPKLAVDRAGNVLIAYWVDNIECGDEPGQLKAEIFVKKWDGKSWVELTSGSAPCMGLSNDEYDSAQVSLALAPDGNPVVAWMSDNRGDYAIYVKRWNGRAWVEVGGGSSSGAGISGGEGIKWFPSIAVDRDGNPTVVWRDDGNGNEEIYLKKFTP